MRHSIFLTVALFASAALSVACSGEDKDFDNPVLQDLDGDGLGYFEDCDDTNAQIGQPDEGCAAGGICTDDSKCVSGVCDLSTPEVRGSQSFGRCARPSCDDNTLNGDETDVDCGGGCDRCRRGKLCAVNRDCDTRLCLEGRCSDVECGDGVVSGDEACDDGNRVNDDACTNTCETARCGDGVRRIDLGEGETGYEACDDGNRVNDDACRNSCLLASCGDGVQDDGEACDDGNEINDDTCSNVCRVAACGDGIVQAGEECDDANDVDTDSCTNLCRHAVCGDGFVRTELPMQDPGFEECDDGNRVDTDECTNGCTLAVCGDGITGPGEECDDGNQTNTDACLNTCVTAQCGDGFAGPGEECDDGNQVSTDDCTNDCTVAVCGDGIVGPDETCDGAVGCGVECTCSDELFTGNDCDECVDSRFGGRFCEVCVDPRFADENCIECAPNHFGPECTPAPCLADGRCPDLDFVVITGNAFQMGSHDGRANEQPIHPVTINAFELLRNEVTVRQYRACVVAGHCDAPVNFDDQRYTWQNSAELDAHPINGVSWHNAKQFALWIGARLPTESEWEYAARSQGRNQIYPWGNQGPNCERLNFDGCEGDDGMRTSRVCAHPAGHSAQGICDLAGNVWEWLEDDIHDSYQGAPNDGSAWVANPRGLHRVCRGGSWHSEAGYARVAFREWFPAENQLDNIGFRVARSLPAN